MRKILIILAASGLLLGAARAQDKADKKEPAAAKAKGKDATGGKADPSGTWTWSFAAPNGQSFDQTATLKLAGDKVSGTVTGRRGDAPISDGTYKDGQIAFSVVRERDGRKMTAKFTGKVEGDAIKGTSTMNRGDGERTVPWEAKRK
jgi:hypothetical protein